MTCNVQKLKPGTPFFLHKKAHYIEKGKVGSVNVRELCILIEMKQDIEGVVQLLTFCAGRLRTIFLVIDRNVTLC